MSTTASHPFLPYPFAVIGHRGAAGHAPENSLEAFEIAFESGVHAIELDVKWVHDQLVVFHDDTVERLTSGQGGIQDQSLADFRNLRLQNGESIPTLGDVWDQVPPSIGINIELKGTQTAKPVAEFIQSHSHRYLISSFHVDELRQFRELAPDVPIALLTRTREDDISATAKSLDVVNIHVIDAVADSSYLQPMMDAGFTIYVFTVNDPQRARELQNLGVRAIFTDVPRTFLEFTDLS